MEKNNPDKKRKRRKKRKKPKRWKRILLWIVGLLLVFLLVISVVFAVFRFLGKGQLQKPIAGEAPMMNTEEVILEEEENWETGWVRYEGKIYAYNEEIMTFLVMGIDSDKEVSKAKDGISGGQSDAMFLAVMNPHSKEISLIAINRNTMTLVDVYDEDGNFTGQHELQITLQHGYGDGMELSCERSVAAVSRFLYNLPVNGYVSINMGAIPELNDAVGGVTLTVMEDIVKDGVELRSGEVVTLTGRQAYQYVRERDHAVFDSATHRLERQKQYLSAFVSQAKQKVVEDFTFALDLYETISRYMVTDIDMTEFTYLASEALGYEFSAGNFYSIKGETVQGEKFEEFYVDEEALYELILTVFYEPVEE